MALTETYLTTTKNLPAFFDALRAAKSPEKFTLKFLEDLGFKSTNDRLYIGLLKSLRMIDENNVPTKRYFDFLDDSRWKQVIAEGVRDAYEELFTLNKRADQLSKADLTGKIKSLTQGKKSDSILEKYIKTLTELIKLGDFTTAPSHAIDLKDADKPDGDGKQLPPQADAHRKTAHGSSHRLIDSITYRIEIQLPPTRDQAIYDAIFRSLREHLL